MCSKRGTKDNTNLAMNSNNTNVQDAKEQYEIERRKNNVVIWGMQEDDSKNAFSLVDNLAKLFDNHFGMWNVIVYVAHKVDRKRS